MNFRNRVFVILVSICLFALAKVFFPYCSKKAKNKHFFLHSCLVQYEYGGIRFELWKYCSKLAIQALRIEALLKFENG